MSDAWSPARRLRFPVDLRHDESIPGAIARGARQHVLLATRPILEAAEVPMKHIGFAQAASPGELERIGKVIRCDGRLLADRVATRVMAGEDSHATPFRFGDLVIPSVFVDLDRRRIAPSALRRSNHHRMDWLNGLLPYCPETLERLVETCSDCGHGLGWRFARGIGVCDYCGSDIQPSTEPPLAAGLADDYRRFARVFSLAPTISAAARGELPESLAAETLQTLLRLAIIVGGVCSDQPLAFSARSLASDVSAPDIAAVVATGMRMLTSWPGGFQNWLTERETQLQGDPDGLKTLRARLRRCHRGSESEELVSLLRAAVPGIGRHAAHGYVGGRYYLYRDVTSLLGLVADQMPLLRRWPELKVRRQTNAAAKYHGQFDVGQIDGLVPAFRDTVALNTYARQLGLPVYALEQMCIAGVVEWEDHPAVLLCKPKRTIRRESIRLFEERVRGAVSQAEKPRGSIALAAAAKRIGGRLKPWSAIMEAFATGSLHFWLDSEQISSGSIKVLPDDLAAFDQVVAEQRGLPDFTLRTTLSQQEAAEVLNLLPYELATEVPHLLPSDPVPGKSLELGIGAVLQVAAELVWPTEVALRLGISAAEAKRRLADMGLVPAGKAWKRRALIKAGLLPAVPHLTDMRV